MASKKKQQHLASWPMSDKLLEAVRQGNATGLEDLLNKEANGAIVDKDS